MADERKVEELNQEAESGCDAPEGEEALTEAPETEAAEAPCEADSREDAGKEQQEDGETAEDGNDAGREKKGFFSKKKDKKEEAYKEQIAELQDKALQKRFLSAFFQGVRAVFLQARRKRKIGDVRNRGEERDRKDSAGGGQFRKRPGDGAGREER